MLKILDSSGKVKFIISDDDDENLSIDELILNDKQRIKEKENEEKKSS